MNDGKVIFYCSHKCSNKTFGTACILNLFQTQPFLKRLTSRPFTSQLHFPQNIQHILYFNFFRWAGQECQLTRARKNVAFKCLAIFSTAVEPTKSWRGVVTCSCAESCASTTCFCALGKHCPLRVTSIN